MNQSAGSSADEQLKSFFPDGPSDARVRTVVARLLAREVICSPVDLTAIHDLELARIKNCGPVVMGRIREVFPYSPQAAEARKADVASRDQVAKCANYLESPRLRPLLL